MIDTEQAAANLGTTPAHVRRLLRNGDLEGEEQEDGTWRVAVSSVTTYKTTRRRPGRPLNALSTKPAEIKGYKAGTPEAEARREYLRIKQRESRARRARTSRRASRKA